MLRLQMANLWPMRETNKTPEYLIENFCFNLFLHLKPSVPMKQLSLMAMVNFYGTLNSYRLT